MASTAPKNLFDVRQSASQNMESRLRGFREVQVVAYLRNRLKAGDPWPSYGEIMRELDFYDRAGAYRVVDRVKRKGQL
jgi:hypothetical protein